MEWDGTGRDDDEVEWNGMKSFRIESNWMDIILMGYQLHTLRLTMSPLGWGINRA